MSNWFGASGGSKSSNISMNPVGKSTSPPVAGPISTTGGPQGLSSGVLTIGSTPGTIGGATSGLGGSGSDVRPDGKHTTGSMGARLP